MKDLERVRVMRGIGGRSCCNKVVFIGDLNIVSEIGRLVLEKLMIRFSFSGFVLGIIFIF